MIMSKYRYQFENKDFWSFFPKKTPCKIWTFLAKNMRIAIASYTAEKRLHACTHTARTFQKSHVLVCAHVCVWEFIFATHSLICNNPLISTFFAWKVLKHDQAEISRNHSFQLVCTRDLGETIESDPLYLRISR